MTSDPGQPFARRVARTREAMRTAGLDAFLITHLPNIRYVTGLGSSAGEVLITATRCVLIVDFRYVTAARELLARREPGAVDLEVVEHNHDETIVGVIRRVAAGRIGVEGAVMPIARFNWLSRVLAQRPSAGGDDDACAVLVPTERVIEQGRVVKDGFEIAALRDGARRLSVVARRLRTLALPGRTESEVAADIDAAMRREGFEAPAFDTIVASGPNGALPHARPGRRALAVGDGVVLDFGGVYDGYCVDLTRTIHLGAAAPAFRRLFDAVAEAHAAAVAAVRPGALPSAIDAAARDVLGQHGLADAFGHGTGHGLGLEVHEEPRIGKIGPTYPDAPVESGMVFTIEPGAYVPGLGGVRIEDDVVVVDGGCEVLTDVPIEL